MIDSCDFPAAKRRAEQTILLPPGPKILVTGGLNLNDYRLIRAKLDRVHEKHPDMVLMHGKSSNGAEKIALLRATNRTVPRIRFSADADRQYRFGDRGEMSRDQHTSAPRFQYIWNNRRLPNPV
jgi:hypothetical protein